MSKPASLFQWDSNGTNTSAVTGGHKTDGYAFSEVPTSAELNQQFKDIADWIEYHELGPDYKVIYPDPKSAINWAVSASTPPGPSPIYLLSSAAGNVAFNITDHIKLGQVLASVYLVIEGDDTVDLTIDLYKHDYSTYPATITNIASTSSTSVPSGSFTTITLNPSDFTYTNNTDFIWLDVGASQAGARIYYLILEFAT